MNRNVEIRGGRDDQNKNEAKKPQLSDLRESGAIEQDADIVCFIHRPDYYRITEDVEGRSLIGVAQIIIAKHRNGATDDIDLYFAKDFAMFVNGRKEYEELVALSANEKIPYTTLGSKTNRKKSVNNTDTQVYQDNEDNSSSENNGDIPPF